MSKHTLGEWVSVGYTNGKRITEKDGSLICTMSRKADRPIDEKEANAALICAAPDLLAVLKEVVAIADRKTDEFDRARAAIAKATMQD